ncbi:hypothetical protein RKD18_004516 [Streptomyces phaeoluteigriseus]
MIIKYNPLLSNNLPYGFKAARSAPRTRPGPRPGLRSCLRPAPARPAPVPRMRGWVETIRQVLRRSGHCQNDASGGGSASTGMEGAPFPASGP